jgi:DNA-binding XRE family transcriptional regulator
MTLKELREALGINQVELDRLAGIDRGTVHKIEAGSNANPSLSVAMAITDALRRAGAKGADIEMLFSQPSERV